MKAAFIFSGQGAQAVGMGKDLFEGSTAAKAVFEKADSVLDWKVSELCFNGPESKLMESCYCQPAIYTMSCACLAAFKEKYPQVEAAGCAGLSLGEFAALQAAGVFSFEEGLQLVVKRGRLMDEACKESVGAMASVLGGELDIIRECCSACGIDVANYNCPGQIVVSGTKEGVDKAMEMMKEKGLRKIIPLKVAGAYHSRLMKGAGERFRKVLDEVSLSIPKIPTAQNFPGSIVQSIDDIRENLVSQVAGSVRWEDCIRTFYKQGMSSFIEFGPGAVLTGLLKRTEKEASGFSINSMDSLNKFAENL
ncbi:MAG: [acyl-carrier-protein] S-malonyltransferase [Lentisphaerae bacterium GWF2_45_14]|nr:MAG: [acyl-carrier-protein] S-malonyltransferase [Lentisphaerae bacterium GWF2_45_14]